MIVDTSDRLAVVLDEADQLQSAAAVIDTLRLDIMPMALPDAHWARHAPARRRGEAPPVVGDGVSLIDVGPALGG